MQRGSEQNAGGRFWRSSIVAYGTGAPCGGVSSTPNVRETSPLPTFAPPEHPPARHTRSLFRARHLASSRPLASCSMGSSGEKTTRSRSRISTWTSPHRGQPRLVLLGAPSTPPHSSPPSHRPQSTATSLPRHPSAKTKFTSGRWASPPHRPCDLPRPRDLPSWDSRESTPDFACLGPKKQILSVPKNKSGQGARRS